MVWNAFTWVVERYDVVDSVVFERLLSVVPTEAGTRHFDAVSDRIQEVGNRRTGWTLFLSLNPFLSSRTSSGIVFLCRKPGEDRKSTRLATERSYIHGSILPPDHIAFSVFSGSVTTAAWHTNGDLRIIVLWRHQQCPAYSKRWFTGLPCQLRIYGNSRCACAHARINLCCSCDENSRPVSRFRYCQCFVYSNSILSLSV